MKSDSLSKKVLFHFFLSRSIVFSIVLFAQWALPPFDKSSLLHISENGFPLSPLAHWDGEHFLDIALHGHRHEKEIAFSPGYPLLIRSFGKALSLSLPFPIPLTWSIFMSGLLLNQLFSFLSALILFKLTLAVFSDERKAYLSTKLFLYNPAGIFFNALYSESSFCLCVFAMCLSIQVGARLLTPMCIAIACTLRSNALLLCVFPFFEWIRGARERAKTRTYLTGLTALIAMTLASISPFVAIQFAYPYMSLCSNHSLNESRPYCHGPTSAYAYVQSRYWGVGLFKYWRISQLPNFLLASPMIWISGQGIWEWMRGRARLKMAPYALIWLACVSICIFLAHVQIVTRFVCSTCPLFYWHCATMLDRHSRLIWPYFLCYLALGSLLFATFLPFT